MTFQILNWIDGPWIYYNYSLHLLLVGGSFFLFSKMLTCPGGGGGQQVDLGHQEIFFLPILKFFIPILCCLLALIFSSFFLVSCMILYEWCGDVQAFTHSKCFGVTLLWKVIYKNKSNWIILEFVPLCCNNSLHSSGKEILHWRSIKSYIFSMYWGLVGHFCNLR